ncbi:hypothetical protein LXL04_036971 [Taraxacum kok-saghyz]
MLHTGQQMDSNGKPLLDNHISSTYHPPPPAVAPPAPARRMERRISHASSRPCEVPPQSMPFTVTDFIFSLLKTTTSTSGTASLINATTRRFIPYSDVPILVRNLAVSLRQPPLSLTNGACAFVIAPNSSYLPIMYLSLFSLGVAVSPSNPASSTQEISRQLRLCRLVVAFAIVESANKLLEVGFPNPVVVIYEASKS